MTRALRTPRRLALLACACAVLVAHPRPAEAQELESLAGAALGGFAGGFLTISAVTAESRAGIYLFSPGEVGWQLSFMPILGLTGAVLGYQDPDRMWNTALWGTAGLFVGVGGGALLGTALWEPPEGKWAGGLIGGGIGMLTGILVGALTHDGEVDPDIPDAPAATFSVRLPW